ncbi:MAG: nucleotidyltransferase domain-containing protein [Candidatus Methanospirareceae archaeon]
MGKKGIRIRDVEHLKKVLKESKFKIEAAFLFGSRAGEDFLEDSDWDLMIISDEFKGMSFLDRATFFLKEVPIRRADIFCYVKSEIAERKNEIGIIREALKGIKVI